ncbi:hypothetical protein Cpir12675_001454 [Ceratocystis pirilliformis]|uniref:Uncharacterized protein n=1 Tax=Ceratocystis pirilliformis TaxID=259994 RepID=A0ABR3ZHM8_9PEZI
MYKRPKHLGHRDRNRNLGYYDGKVGSSTVPPQYETAKLIEFRQYPEGIVLGLDRFWYLQPQVIMPNSHFWPMNVERDSWDYVEYNWDMAHARMLMGNIYNWDQLYSKIFKHLRPGTGYFEQVDFDFTFRSEDNSITPSTVFHVWNTKYKDAMNKLGCSVDIDGLAIQRKLRNAGFVDVTMEIKQVPVNPWQRGSEDIGRFMNLAFTHSLQGMLLRPLTRAGGMTPNQVNELVQQLGTEMCYMHWKPYVNL